MPRTHAAPGGTRALVSRSPSETKRIAGRLVRRLRAGAVVALHGELGSGKTCFVQGMAAALGVKQAVTSPTFTLVNEYAGRLPLYHADLYRIRGPEELLGIGFDSYIESGGITVVEWAERAADLIPPHAVHVTLSARADPRERDIRVGPSRVRSAKC